MLGLASAYHDQGSFDEAEALFTEALARGGGRPDPAAATAMVNLGMIHRLREEYPKAVPLVRRALEMRSALFEPDHPDRIEVDEHWAATLVALGRYREAEPVYLDALERSIRVLGEGHIRTRNIREGLMGLDWAVGRLDLALARADSVRLAKLLAHGGDHPGVVYTLNSMGQILVESGHLREARARLDEAMAMGERLGGTDGVYGALIRNNLGTVALLEGKLGEAGGLMDQALALGRANLREDHRYIQEIQRSRARLRLARGDAPGALALLGPVLVVEEGGRPSPHPRRGETQLLRARALAMLGDAEAARTTFAEADGEFRELPEDHPFRREAREGIAASGGGGGTDR